MERTLGLAEVTCDWLCLLGLHAAMAMINQLPDVNGAMGERSGAIPVTGHMLSINRCGGRGVA